MTLRGEDATMPKSAAPFLEVARIQSEINHLFENLMDLEGATASDGTTWIPNVDILETADALLVHAELPGVAADALRVSVGGGQLVLQGERRRPGELDAAKLAREERAFGRFRRTVQLGVPVNTRQAEAALVDGLLRIRFPKVPNRRGEEVPIEVSTP